MQKKNDILGIEILRFIAAFSVLIWHYQHFWYEGTIISSSFEISDQPFFSILQLFYFTGYNGVQLFWAISGYIFFYVYFVKIKNSEISSRNFIVRRFSRLYPLHFITLILVLILQIASLSTDGNFYIYLENDIKHFFLNILFVNHWGLQENLSYNGPIWSVSIEIAVLIIFFILSRFFNTFWVFLFSIILLLVFINYNFHISECIFLFFSGGLIYLIKSNKKLLKFGSSFFYCFVIFLGFLVFIDILFIDVHNFYLAKFSLYLKCIFILSFFASINNLITKLNLQKLCKVLGSWTYASYLMHIPIQLIIFNLSFIFDFEIPKEKSLFFLTYLFTVFFISHLIYKFIERPIQNLLRKKFLKKN